MKLRDRLVYLCRGRGKRIANWGDAELLHQLNGRYELRGGSPEERQAAREWISMFMHEAVVASNSNRSIQSSVP